MIGQWLWLSWQSGCFRLQRSDPRFESSHRQFLYYKLYLGKSCIEKAKIKKKRPGMARFYTSQQDPLSYLGSGCGAVGRVVALDTRDPWFEFSHQQYYLLSTILKSKQHRFGDDQSSSSASGDVCSLFLTVHNSSRLGSIACDP